MNNSVPEIQGNLRKHALRVPSIIEEVGGISIFGKRIRSLVFSTDVSIICNVNADAVLAVYPFTPQPKITAALLSAADMPILCGVGGGITTGKRVLQIAKASEMQGALGIVVNSPTENEVIRQVVREIEIPLIATVISEKEDFAARIEAGVSIFNVSAAAQTAQVVAQIRRDFPDFPIIATGGPTDETIRSVIDAGANAIPWTPPTARSLMHDLMADYRLKKDKAAL